MRRYAPFVPYASKMEFNEAKGRYEVPVEPSGKTGFAGFMEDARYQAKKIQDNKEKIIFGFVAAASVVANLAWMISAATRNDSDNEIPSISDKANEPAPVLPKIQAAIEQSRLQLNR